MVNIKLLQSGLIDGYSITTSSDIASIQLMQFLEIPVSTYSGTVCSKDLYDIMMDEEKLKKIVSKLKCKAFW